MLLTDLFLDTFFIIDMFSLGARSRLGAEVIGLVLHHLLRLLVIELILVIISITLVRNPLIQVRLLSLLFLFIRLHITELRVSLVMS